jgi:UDP-N-acetylglucosamine:LPS N-acetylglucosamine transferase
MELLITKLAKKEEEIGNLKFERDKLLAKCTEYSDTIPLEKYQKLVEQLVEEEAKAKMLKSSVKRLTSENDLYKNIIEQSN